MGISNDSKTDSKFTLLHHYVNRRSLLKAMGLLGLGLVPLISACGDLNADQNAAHDERKNSAMEAAIEQPKTVSKLPLMDTDLPPQIETATLAMG